MFTYCLQAGRSTVEGSDCVKDVESTVFQSVYSSDRNVLVTVPLGFDKSNIVILAVMNALDAPSDSLNFHKLQLKVTRTRALYLERMFILQKITKNTD
jgi:replicative superfamily II helicase